MRRLNNTCVRAFLALICCVSTTVFGQTPEQAQAPQQAQAGSTPADDSLRFDIRRFSFSGATLISPERLTEATRQFTGDKRQFSDVQRALEVIERMYSESGYSAVQVVLPEQELEKGDIRFQITEAKIGRVIVEGNKFFDEANIRASVPALVPGKSPNINDIAKNLRLANDSPAKQSNVLLRSAQEEATVDAVVRVVDEKFERYSVSLDNTGQVTPIGRFRLGVGYQNSNLRNSDHILTLQYVGAPHDEVHTNRLALVPSSRVMVLGLGYKIPLYASGDALEFTAGYSNVGSGTVANLFTITGAGTVLGVRYTHNLDRLGDYEHRVSFALDERAYHNKGVRPLASTTQIIPDVTVHPVSVIYSGQLRSQDSETGGTIAFSQNIRGGNDGDLGAFCLSRSSTVGDQFECANGRYAIWRWGFNHNRALSGDWQWRIGINGQITRDMLISGEQYGVGGADSVRGFLEREITNDQGYRGTTELYTPDFGGYFTAVDGLRVRALAFYDWAGVKRNRPGPGEAHAAHVGSMGLGLRVARGNNLTLRLDLAWVTDEGARPNQNGVSPNQGVGDGRAHASLSYVF